MNINKLIMESLENDDLLDDDDDDVYETDDHYDSDFRSPIFDVAHAISPAVSAGMGALYLRKGIMRSTDR